MLVTYKHLKSLLLLSGLFLSMTATFSQNWPMWAGSYGNFMTDSIDSTVLINDFNEVDSLWRSSEETPGAKASGHTNASPIVYENKVYQFYVNESDQDVIVAFNSDDGSLAWEKTYDGSIYYENTSKTGSPQNLTPAAGEGKIFSTGLANRVYALDADNGTEIWNVPLNGNVNNGDHGGAVIYVDSVVVVPDYNGDYSGLVGFDADNGSEIWRIPSSIGDLATPSIYRENGKKYLIAGTPDGEIRCIDPIDGTVEWMITGKGYHQRGLTVAGNHMMICDSSDEENNIRWSCYNISSNGATKKWDMPSSIDFDNPDERPVIYGNAVYLSTDGPDHFYCLDLDDGSVLSKIDLTNSWNSTLQIVNGYLLFEPDANHTYQNVATIYLIDPDPENFRVISRWMPPHERTCGYSVPMARPVVNGQIYFRGDGGIYCYDLEKKCTKDQKIEFPEIANKELSASDFNLSASATSGLPVNYSIEKGPATIAGSTVSLTGDSGVVTITVYQPGDTIWCPADSRSRSFVVGNPVPPKPLNVRAEAIGATEIRVMWNDPSSMEDYFFVERQNSSGKWIQAGRVHGDTTFFNDGGLTEGETYKYRVYGYCGDVNSQFSDIVSAATYILDTDIWLEPECENVPVGWSIIDETGASNGQIVEANYKPAGDPGPDEIIAFEIDVGLSAYYKLWVYSQASGGGSDSYKSSVDDTASWNPTGVSGTGTWEWNKGSEYYLTPGIHTLYIGIRESGFKLDKVLLTTSKKTPSSLSYDAMNCGLGEVPDAPNGIDANSISSNEINISWNDASDNEDLFIIERKTNTTDYVQVGNVAADTTSYTDNSCNSNTTYTYRLRAYNLYGASSYTAEASSTTSSSSAIDAPTNLSSSLDNGMIHLSWDDNSTNENAFRIQVKEGDWGYTDYDDVDANVTSFTMPVDKTADYSFRVFAYNNFKRSDYSNETVITSDGKRGYDLQIGKAANMPIIDGNMESEWDSAINNPLTLIIEGKNSPVGEIGCAFRALWDTSALYFFVDVTDNNIYTDGVYPSEDDGVELFVDRDNSKDYHFGSSDYHFNFVWGSAPIEKNGYTSGVVKEEKETSDGYTMEIKIPWSTLQVSSPAKNHQIGLEMHCIDDEYDWHDHTRDNVLAWHAQVNQQRRQPSLYNEYFYYGTFESSFYWPYPSEWGTAILKDKAGLINNIQQPQNKKEETQSKINISVYPNPTKGNIKLSSTVEHIQVYSILGEEILDKNNVNRIDISSQPDGIYLIKIGDHMIKVIKK